MNFVSPSLFLNHFPIIGTLVGLGLLLISLLGKNETCARRASLFFRPWRSWRFRLFSPGLGAHGGNQKTPRSFRSRNRNAPGRGDAGAAFMEITGGLSVVALWKTA